MPMKMHFNASEVLKPTMNGLSGIDQNILDEIGANLKPTDSDSEENDVLPVPLFYAQSQSRNSLLSRSKSIGSFDTSESSVHDEDCYSGAKSCAGTTLMLISKRFATGIEPQQTAQSLDGGMRRSASMPCVQKTRSDYNRVVGEALANSPKKAPVNTAEEMAFIEKLLSEL